jgi:hypothetical protein
MFGPGIWSGSELEVEVVVAGLCIHNSGAITASNSNSDSTLTSTSTSTTALPPPLESGIRVGGRLRVACRLHP